MDNDKLYICKKCIKELEKEPYTSPFQYRGLFTNFKVPEDKACPRCKNNLYETQVTINEIKILFSISHDNQFLGSMIYLKEKDPIEYQLKLSQFKANLSQTKAVEENNVPKCPYCHSTNTKKISTTSKVVNTALFGIFGQKRKHQWHCNNCGSDF